MSAVGAPRSVVHKNYVSQLDLEPIGLVKLVNADDRSLTPDLLEGISG